MSEKLQLLLALHALLADQIEAAKRDLTPEELTNQSACKTPRPLLPGQGIKNWPPTIESWADSNV
jgi:hypothetical protein